MTYFLKNHHVERSFSLISNSNQIFGAFSAKDSLSSAGANFFFFKHLFRGKKKTRRRRNIQRLIESHTEPRASITSEPGPMKRDDDGEAGPEVRLSRLL